jgi:alkanesulfonate monooxygenase SsuD/methylene tetrahydromethanopterin reductase-like flavin-dependent oxidoreductase (luciferase family)
MNVNPRPDQAGFRVGISAWAADRGGVERVAGAALSAGIDTFWLGDGLLERPDFPPWSGGMESFTELAWLAGRYPGISLGLGAAVLPLRDPRWVAKSAATLDQLTQGRFTLVLAPGNWPDEFAAMDRDFDGRGAALEAGFWSLKEIWSAGAGNASPSPRPWSPGGPPIWLAGARATMLRAIRLGLPFQASRVGPAALVPTAREWFERGGTKLAVRVRMGVGRAGSGAAPTATGTGALIGPAAFLAEQVEAYRQLGVTDLSIMPGQDAEACLRTIEALAAEALPALAP